jgi:hypothetical protein
MLIDSKFHDYYDNMMSNGVDRDCVYSRVTKNIGKDKDIDTTLIPYSSGKITTDFGDMEFTPIIIGFAGKIYKIIRLIGYVNSSKQVTQHFFSINQYKDFIEENELELSKSRFSWFFRGGIDSIAGAKAFYENNYSSLDKLFVKHNVPVFQIELEKNSPVLILNPKLKDVDFVKVKDCFTAYQEIFMFKAGVLGNPDKEIITISDKVKAQQYGHDHKYSFKKEPKTKK